ncbi:MAG: LysR family transcriptional regulator [Bacilli bacterium]|nr:LysR family transcriptional regulator [Bacilli bacterium]
MGLDLWNIFYEVASAHNISKASEKLHISQPAITKQIKKLEDYLNCKLFIRSQKGVILTQEGRVIYEDIENALKLFQLAEKKIRADNELLSGKIRIGISTSLTKAFLMPYIRIFHNKYPNIILEISTDPTSTLKHALKKGKLDFIVAKFSHHFEDEFQYKKLGQMKDIFIANNDYKDLAIKKLSLQELVNFPILLQKQPSSSRDCFETYCKENKVKLKSVMEIASSNLLIDFTKIGYGIGLVTKEYVKKELEKNELYELNVIPEIPPRDFGIILLNNDYLTKATLEFLKVLESDKK